jgi:hypothetical protein
VDTRKEQVKAQKTMAERAKPEKAYVQYSKRLAVVALAIGWGAYVITLWRIGDDAQYSYRAFSDLLMYTFGILSLYNGNSVTEKFFASKYSTAHDSEA